MEGARDGSGKHLQVALYREGIVCVGIFSPVIFRDSLFLCYQLIDAVLDLG